MTYAESRGGKYFDWNEFLNREDISEEEWNEARHLSDGWVTCACGNMCDVIPREYDGAPYDTVLYLLGIDFFEYIDSKDKDQAKKTLGKIEKRSEEIIKELNDV